MVIKIEINGATLRKMIMDHIHSRIPGAEIRPENIDIMVKSKQNYRSEWESAAFKAEIKIIED